MYNFWKILGLPLVGFGAITFMAPAVAVGRSGDVVNSARAMTGVQRMPTMPSLPMDSLGNVVPNGPTDNNTNLEPPVVPPVEPPVEPPVVPPVVPESECPDGGVKDSEYTVEKCMKDILFCVNTGALSGGINDLFNDDLRNSIENGMNLCAAQVDKCILDVREDCASVYRSRADVWIDFNSREIQPAYYNFVLRKTGLTPNQAENTCRLLDKNTYGASFNAVSNNGSVTAEYDKKVGAYNSQNGNILIKSQPQGLTVNDNNRGVDGQRGHYARWDATTAQCFVRVAAYNKDEHITNTWLFGALGDDKPAEVWKETGDVFTCDKDLFGFSLMNDTSTAAVVGLGGGAVVGAGVGAIAGHGARNFDCSNSAQVKELTKQLRVAGNLSVINEYLINDIPAAGADITTSQCNSLVNLYNDYIYANSLLLDVEEQIEIEIDVSGTDANVIAALENIPLQISQSCNSDACVISNDCGSGTGQCVNNAALRAKLDVLQDALFSIDILAGEKSNMGASIATGTAIGVGAGGLATAITAFVERNNISCRVGDGLGQAAYGKSYSIGSLKDFYVKWDLKLPDTIMPTPNVVDCNSWKRTCATLTDLNECKAAQINYKPAGAPTVTLVRTACAPSGSVCVENYPVAKSYGACE